MIFENQKSESIPNSAENLEQAERRRQGVYLKGLVALTTGVLSARKKRTPGTNFLAASVERAKETYKSLDDLEKYIDPSGNLSADVAELTTNGLSKLADWLEAHGGAPKEKK